MKNLILVAVILQLVITISQIQTYQFGDIISFERRCGGTVFYKHFAIYVDNETLTGRRPEDDIFHFTKQGSSITCTFDELKETTGKVDNYFDGGLTMGTQEEIKARIQAARTHCGLYNLFTNNCEHLATFVRYGEKFSLQNGTFVAKLCSKTSRSCTPLKKKAEELIENAKKEAECMKKSEASSSRKHNG
ncbi:phospholipase A and acyltransferase 1 [Lates calcarifer]|uniref:Phospholipase A and acyltransferase 1 n=1 Tax=Lates calcarifer TaxID=8187 RepID=A0AAJ8B1Q8_LATCA|nr:phospholipase A and acyltransferase 1 [Lates calcarifer]